MSRTAFPDQENDQQKNVEISSESKEVEGQSNTNSQSTLSRGRSRSRRSFLGTLGKLGVVAAGGLFGYKALKGDGISNDFSKNNLAPKIFSKERSLESYSKIDIYNSYVEDSLNNKIVVRKLVDVIKEVDPSIFKESEESPTPVPQPAAGGKGSRIGIPPTSTFEKSTPITHKKPIEYVEYTQEELASWTDFDVHAHMLNPKDKDAILRIPQRIKAFEQLSKADRIIPTGIWMGWAREANVEKIRVVSIIYDAFDTQGTKINNTGIYFIYNVQQPERSSIFKKTKITDPELEKTNIGSNLEYRNENGELLQPHPVVDRVHKIMKMTIERMKKATEDFTKMNFPKAD